MAGHFATQFTGTISSGGSLSQVIDTQAFEILGLVVYPQSGTMVAGSVQFRVSPYNGNEYNGTLYDLYDNAGARVALNIGTAGRAYGFAQTETIAPYRYVQIEMTANQDNAVTVVIPAKAV